MSNVNDWEFIPFEGLDFRTKQPYCAHCQKHWADALCFGLPPPKPVKKCSACKLVYYCSRECQLADRNIHKRACKTIKKQRELVATNEASLRKSSVPFFETHVGDFWDLAFPYVKSRYDLALLIHPSAFETNLLGSVQEMNGHMQELLRLIHNHVGNHDYGMSQKFPNFLLHEGRDDEAYAFCRFVMQRWYSGNTDSLHEGSAEGDFIYPCEQNCRFNNFLQECPDLVNEECVSFLVVIWLIKKRLLCTIVSRDKAFRTFLATERGQRLDTKNRDVCFHIHSFLVGQGDDEGLEGMRAWLENQDRQLDELSDRIDAVNPILIPAFADPMAVLGRPMPAWDPDGGALRGEAQVWCILSDCHRYLDCLPGLVDWIAQRYGGLRIRRTVRVG